MVQNTKKISDMFSILTTLQGLSPCNDGHVAALITDRQFNTIHAAATNGGTAKYPCLCVLGSKYGCIHAEVRTLNVCKEAKGKILLTTLSPCLQCAASIVAAGISEVYYLQQWKNTAGIELLQNSGVFCDQYSLEEDVAE